MNENENERMVYKIKISSGLFFIVLVCQNHREMNLQRTILKHKNGRINQGRHCTHHRRIFRSSVLHSLFTCGCWIISLSIARGQTIERFIHFVQSQRTPFKSIALMRIISFAWRIAGNLLRHTIPPIDTHTSQLRISILRKLSMRAHMTILMQSLLSSSCSSLWFINIQLYLYSSWADARAFVRSITLRRLLKPFTHSHTRTHMNGLAFQRSSLVRMHNMTETYSQCERKTHDDDDNNKNHRHTPATATATHEEMSAGVPYNFIA